MRWKRSPWVLVVEAEGNLVDRMGVGHDQIESILQGKAAGLKGSPVRLLVGGPCRGGRAPVPSAAPRT